jgi:hypothetical protein
MSNTLRFSARQEVWFEPLRRLMAKDICPCRSQALNTSLVMLPWQDNLFFLTFFPLLPLIQLNQDYELHLSFVEQEKTTAVVSISNFCNLA